MHLTYNPKWKHNLTQYYTKYEFNVVRRYLQRLCRPIPYCAILFNWISFRLVALEAVSFPPKKFELHCITCTHFSLSVLISNFISDLSTMLGERELRVELLMMMMVFFKWIQYFRRQIMTIFHDITQVRIYVNMAHGSMLYLCNIISIAVYGCKTSK